MTRLILCITLMFLFISCEKFNEKEYYIKEKIPMLYENLNTSQLDSFKNSMLIKEGKLLSFDSNLLRKGTAKDFDSVIVNITRDLGGVIENIILTDSIGKEVKINSKKYIFNSLDNENYILQDFTTDKTYILMISTSCGFCLQAFKKLNEIAEKNTDKDKKFVAIFQNSKTEIDNYKKGYSIENFGFLSNKWIKFTKENDFSKKLHLPYNPYDDGYPTLLYKKNNTISKAHNSEKIYKILTTK